MNPMPPRYVGSAEGWATIARGRAGDGATRDAVPPCTASWLRAWGQRSRCIPTTGGVAVRVPPDDYRLQTEVQDLKSILDSTGSSRVIGHSVGGFLALAGGQPGNCP